MTPLDLKWPFIFGSLFLLIVLGIVAFGGDPTPTQYQLYRIIIALGGAGFAVALTGSLEVQFPLLGNGFVKATAAFGVFVVLFFFSPAGLAVDEGKLEANRLIDQYFASPDSEVVTARKLLGDNWSLETGGRDLTENASQPNQKQLEDARDTIRNHFRENAESRNAFSTITTFHVRVFDCIKSQKCDPEPLCSNMFREIEGFKNTFCDRIIEESELLGKSLWSDYKEFSETICKRDFLDHYIDFQDIANLKDSCLPVQCWARNVAPPYPCDVRNQVLGGIMTPI